MKRQIIFILLIFTLNITFAQTWKWSHSGGSVLPGDVGTSLCKDSDGNIYVAGKIKGTLPSEYINYAIFNGDTVPIRGVSDIFLAKYDKNGYQLWVKSFGGPYDNWHGQYGEQQKIEGVSRIVYSSYTNSIYLISGFIGSCYLGEYKVYAHGGVSDEDILCAKLDLDGNCIWAKSAGGYGDDFFGNLAVTPAGNVFITGRTRYNGIFDTINLSNGGFLAKYDDNGNLKWAKNICNGLKDFPYGAAGNPEILNICNDDIFILVDKKYDTLYVDTVLYSGESHPYILAKFDSTGNIIWSKEIIKSDAVILDFHSDKNDNFYLGGKFENRYIIIETDTIYSTGDADSFFIKYNKDGDFQWIKQINASFVLARGISSDTIGNVYLTGDFSGNATFETFNISSNTKMDLYVARYNSNGDCLGVVHTGYGSSSDVLANNDGSCIITGYFGMMRPGQWSIKFGSKTLLSHGYDDFFIAKLDTMDTKGKTQYPNNQLFIYANPNTGKCNISIPENFVNEENLTLCIFDNVGKLIEQIKLDMTDDKIKLDLEHEAKGIYTVTLSNGKKVYTGKIVLE